MTSTELSEPISDAEIRVALGNPPNLGQAYVCRDGTTDGILYLVVRGGSDSYYYLKMTKAG